MSKPGPRLFPLTPAHHIGLGSVQLTALLYWLGQPAAVALLPILLQVILLVFLAPLFPGWRLFGPYITKAPSPDRVALTFDDGPHPRTTGPLLDLLGRRQVRACFFQVGSKVAREPDLTRRVLEEGHEVGNHTHTHDVMLSLRTRARVSQEIQQAQEAYAPLNVRPLCFRPPVGIVNPRLWPALLRQGLYAVGFSRRAMDWGNRKVPGLAGRLLRGVRGGDILLLHDCPGGDQFSVEAWLGEVEAVLDGLEQRGLKVEPLSQLLGRPVMERTDTGTGAKGAGASPVAAFYDGLAGAYDREQESRGAAAVRGAERRVVEARLSELASADHRVLEVGAGTGRFTLGLASRVREVTALDVSAGMLALLDEGARERGLENITTVRGEVEQCPLNGPYDLICSFSALEYVRDLEPLLRRLSNELSPGGRLYFTTAHSGPLRLWTQLGNAMRQGIWLKARTRGEVRRALKAAGLEPELIETHALKLPLFGGMLIEVLARESDTTRGAVAAPGHSLAEPGETT